MKGKDWWILIAVVIIIAVVASLITMKLTGNVIAVAKGTAGKVYTTAEIDAKLKNIATTNNVLDMLNKCSIERTGSDDKSCNNLCGPKKCISAEALTEWKDLTTGKINYATTTRMSCSQVPLNDTMFKYPEVGDIDTICVCC
jgi:hypothetical protein